MVLVLVVRTIWKNSEKVSLQNLFVSEPSVPAACRSAAVGGGSVRTTYKDQFPGHSL